MDFRLNGANAPHRCIAIVLNQKVGLGCSYGASCSVQDEIAVGHTIVRPHRYLTSAAPQQHCFILSALNKATQLQKLKLLSLMTRNSFAALILNVFEHVAYEM